MNLDIKNWGEFRVGDIFPKKDIKKYSSFPETEGSHPFISSSSQNNGISGYVDEEVIEGNCITISTNGECFSAYYHSKPIVVSSDVEVLYNEHLNYLNALFICTILTKEKYRWSYGRKPKNNHVYNTLIQLPITSKSEPDWIFMEKFMQTLNHKEISSANNKQVTISCQENWGEFIYDDLFTIKKGKRLTKNDMVPGDINYIGAISVNNGIRQQISNTEHVSDANCITVNYNGSVGEAFYQKDPFWASDDVNILYLKDYTLNKYLAMFLCTLIKIERQRFSYGRKWKLDKMKNTKIKLPINDDNKPDWNYMERVVRSLKYADRI